MPDGTYTAPELKTALIDFYILSRGIPKRFNKHQSLQRFRLNTINSWRRTLIRDIEFCIACEARHMADGVTNPLCGSWDQLFEQQFGPVGVLWNQKWRTLKLQQTLPPVIEIEFAEDMLYVMNENAGNTQRRKGSYIASKIAEQQHGLSLIEVCKVIFDFKHVKWEGGYGGTTWQRIAQTLLDLWHSTNLSEIITLIDTAFALQHNTSTVFNKNIVWKGRNNFAWITRWLDYKWAAHSPMSLLGFASPELVKLITDNGFQSQEDLPPKALRKNDTTLKTGDTIKLKEGNEDITAVVCKVMHQGYFSSYVLSSKHYKATKVWKKKQSQMKLRVYSQAELLSRFIEMVDKQTIPITEIATKPTASVKVVPIAKFKAIIAYVYASVSAYLAANKTGLTVGSLCSDGNIIRFRIKESELPLRFYFTTNSQERLVVSVSMTVTEKYSLSSALMTTDGVNVANLCKTVLGVVDAHIKQHKKGQT